MQNQNDLKIVSDIIAGNKEQFNTLVNSYSEKAFNLALRVTRDVEDAEEVVQEIFITVFNKLGSFKGESQFSSWFYRIAMNCALMKLRTRKRHVASSLTEDEHEEASDNTCDLGYMATRSELQVRLEAAIAKLPELYRQIFVLRDIEGVSNEEASLILDVSVTALKSRLHRARLMLRRSLKKVYQEYTGVTDEMVEELLAA